MNERFLRLLRQAFTPIAIALVIGASMSLLRAQSIDIPGIPELQRYLHLADIRLMDFRMLQRGWVDPRPDIVIVAIDDRSIAEVGRWPWPRTVLAQLVERIAKMQPKVLAFDMVFSEPSSFLERPGVSAKPDHVTAEAWTATQHVLDAQDQAFGESIRAFERVALGYFFNLDQGMVAPGQSAPSIYEMVRGTADGSGEAHVLKADTMVGNLPGYDIAAAASGYFNQIPDSDGFVRRIPMAIRFGSEDDMAVPLEIAALKVAYPDRPFSMRFEHFGAEGIYWGDQKIPVAEDGQLLINYRGPGRIFPHISAADILDEKLAPHRLLDKIVVMGVTAVAVADIRVTPFDENFPGVEVHANVLDNILKNDFVSQPNWLVLADVAVIVGFAAVLGLGMRRWRGVAAAGLAILLLGTYLYVSQEVFVRYGYPLSVVYPLLTLLITYSSIAVQQYVTEEREKSKVRKALELYLSPSMAGLVSNHPEWLKLGGEKRELTVLFSDIRGFTRISEGLEPEALVELLNEYLGEMTEIVFRHDGMLDKYIGDAVMALWGAPLPQPTHAAQACEAAIEMVRRLADLNNHWQERGWEPLAIGIGLNSGPMAFGNMGSAQHMSITAMGDNVNLGSRIEGLTKGYGANILASEATVRAAGDTIVVRELDLIRVRGKQEPVRVFEILALGSEREKWSELVADTAAAMDLYRLREWAAAAEGFDRIVARWPKDKVAKVFAERCRRLDRERPADWDPVLRGE